MHRIATSQNSISSPKDASMCMHVACMCSSSQDMCNWLIKSTCSHWKCVLIALVTSLLATNGPEWLDLIYQVSVDRPPYCLCKKPPLSFMFESCFNPTNITYIILSYRSCTRPYVLRPCLTNSDGFLRYVVRRGWLLSQAGGSTLMETRASARSRCCIHEFSKQTAVVVACTVCSVFTLTSPSYK